MSDAIERFKATRTPPRAEERRVGNPTAAAAGSAQQMKVQTIEDDYLICKTWDGAAEGGTSINVAKPMVLRKASAWPNGSGSYGSWGTGGQTRTDTSTDPDETQAVVVPYVTSGAGQIITAFRPQGGTGLTVGGVPVAWEDCNNDGRAWCKT